jgi:arginyl-tRNA--protein-N-Asp/Glu arginylyltransferase
VTVQHTGLPNSLKLPCILYSIGLATSTLPTNRKKRNNDDNKKRLTKVLSTKLSIEDYNRFQKYTNYAYQAGMIEEPNTSRFLRFIITCPFNELGLL